MGSTEKFFDKKRAWSEKKDKILGDYLSPYLNKIIYTNKPILFVDCFAGKGKFDDGTKGSPLIILDKCEEFKKSKPLANIKQIFIEKRYGEELERNVNGLGVTVWKDEFEHKIRNICASAEGKNVFLYIDPYGIKSLDFEAFKRIKECKYYSLEMLMNFNSFGFLREACRLMKSEDSKVFSDEDTDYLYESDVNDIPNMIRIANGDYWQDIIKQYNIDEDMFRAEEAFARKYIQQISKLFKYVLHIPIKIKSFHIPKYRLIFGTNKDDGALLMFDKMHEIWSNILKNERNGQMVLFEAVKPDSTLSEVDFEPDFLKEVMKYDGFVNVREVVMNMVKKYGITYGLKEYKDLLKKLENVKIELRRIPEVSKTGKIRKFYSFEDNRNTLEVKIK
jgi:three-Cys-motif partner protein